MNYGELKTLIKDYLHRSDMDTRIPGFIVLAQARMSRDLQVLEMEHTGTVTTIAGDDTADVPTGMTRLIRINMPGVGPLEQTTAEDIAVRNAGGSTGNPRLYARYADKFLLSPIPGSEIALPVLYASRLLNFSDDSDTDDLLTNNPNIYIYAAMLEALPFLVDKNPIWREAYGAEVSGLNAQAEEARWSGGPIGINTSLGVTIR